MQNPIGTKIIRFSEGATQNRRPIKGRGDQVEIIS